jgi:hypothetical protein
MRLSMAVPVALIGLVALMAGCDVFSPDEGDSGQPQEISEYGGFTISDEAPAFGDTELLSGYPEDQPFDDDMENHPDVTRARNNRGASQYALRIIWGNIETRDSTRTDAENCPVSDWSGTLEVDGGLVIVKRLILFEPGDSILRPRGGPKTIRWVSHTSPHVDGLLLKIMDVPDPSSTESRNSLTITTPFYSKEISLAELEDYREFVVYDDCNAISIVATRIEPLGCPRGFLEGRWIADTDTSGHFKGVWIGNLGTLMGHLRGVYGIREGQRVIFGKWVDTSGEFQGLLKGTWMPLEGDRGPDGIFEGRWVDENLETTGFLRGHYAVCPGDTLGMFQGRWRKDCK